MKVAIVNSYYSKGGAARAALRLQEALLRAGVDVDYKYVYEPQMSLWSKLIRVYRVMRDRLPALIKAKKKVMFSSGMPSNPNLVYSLNNSDADIVHLHWINAGGLSVEDILNIKKPVVISLHDMWFFTGGCHYDSGCGRFTDGCGACPILGSKDIKDMSSNAILNKVKKFDSVSGLTVVGLSRWIADCAKRSVVFSNADIVNLPNPIDITLFYPEERIRARELLGLAPFKRLILFGAIGAADDARKGYKELMLSLSLLDHGSDVEFVVFGMDKPNNPPDFGLVANYMGNISSDAKLRLLYSAADVMVVPSLQENLSNAIMESLACATPVVAFDIGGNGDMIDHLENGYLATPEDFVSLAHGINWVLNESDYTKVASGARAKVEMYFDYTIVGAHYKRLYTKCLDRQSAISGASV